MVLGKIISSEGYTFGQKWIISMIFRSFFITCIHKYGPNSVAASKMISIFMIFYYLYGIFWYCEVRSVGSLTLIKSRFRRGVYTQVYLFAVSFTQSGLNLTYTSRYEYMNVNFNNWRSKCFDSLTILHLIRRIIFSRKISHNSCFCNTFYDVSTDASRHN